MKEGRLDYGLEFLLAFNGRIHHLEKGYWLKFVIMRIEATPTRPHGLSYSFTLHGPDGTRLVGFDNAHSARAASANFKPRGTTTDHWHRTADDPGRPYVFRGAEALLDDFFHEVERALRERGIDPQVIADSEKTK